MYLSVVVAALAIVSCHSFQLHVPIEVEQYVKQTENRQLIEFLDKYKQETQNGTSEVELAGETIGLTGKMEKVLWGSNNRFSMIGSYDLSKTVDEESTPIKGLFLGVITGGNISMEKSYFRSTMTIDIWMQNPDGQTFGYKSGSYDESTSAMSDFIYQLVKHELVEHEEKGSPRLD